MITQEQVALAKWKAAIGRELDTLTEIIRMYDIASDEMRPTTLADIKQMEAYVMQFGALRRLLKLTAATPWDGLWMLEKRAIGDLQKPAPIVGAPNPLHEWGVTGASAPYRNAAYAASSTHTQDGEVKWQSISRHFLRSPWMR